jgi:cytochrome c oxidase assembly protein subunit 15
MRLYRSLIIIAAVLAFGVITLGAYVRLSDAGLGCPEWPGCYGHLIGVPDAALEQAAALAAFPDRPVEAPKAWKEMVHRYFAGSLGVLIAAICALGWRHRRLLGQPPTVPSLLVAVVVFQALLGMWTVTLLLKPVIVTGHLLGGMTTLALLVWLCFAPDQSTSNGEGLPPRIRWAVRLALVTVVVQIALGGWVSSNYAALACSDFPTCQGHWLPEMNFLQAFELHRPLGETSDGTLLSNAALTAIHWSHRVGALVVTLIVGYLTLALAQHAAWRHWAGILATALALQIVLGIANVLLSLPLPLAVAHNAGAAALLTAVLALNIRVSRTANTVPSRTETQTPPAKTVEVT